jgi:hypothetical protein
VAGPGDALVGREEDLDVRFGARIAADEIDHLGVRIGGEPALIGFGIGDRCREADAAEPGRDFLEARHGKAEEVAAFAGGEGVDLVDDDGGEVAEEEVAVLVAEEEAERFGRGQQHLRRADALALLAVGRRVAGAGLDADGEVHLLDRSEEIALNVGCERLQRRDVEGVEAVGGRFDQLYEAGEEAGQRLAGSGRRDEQGAPPGAGGGEHLLLVAAQRPALAGEPAGYGGRQAFGLHVRQGRRVLWTLLA